MVSVMALAQALPSASSGVDWLYQFTNNLTNLTTQNGGALTQFGLIGAELHLSVCSHQHGRELEYQQHDVPASSRAAARRRPRELPLAADYLLAAAQLLGESVPRRELRDQSLLLLHRPSDGRRLRSELARQPAAAPQDGRRQHVHAVLYGAGRRSSAISSCRSCSGWRPPSSS